MIKHMVNIRIIIFSLLALLPVSSVMGKQDYTYIQSSLAFPWFMFFVFFALIMIPFFMVIGLAWGESKPSDNTSSTEAEMPHHSASDDKRIFNRFVLPTILAAVGIFSILLVLNAYEAMDLMEQYGTAAPTMLNARP